MKFWLHENTNRHADLGGAEDTSWYDPGSSVESDRDLAVLFPNKFTELEDSDLGENVTDEFPTAFAKNLFVFYEDNSPLPSVWHVASQDDPVTSLSGPVLTIIV